MEIGDAFLLVDKDLDSHLWVVISLPQISPDTVVIVNLTSWDKLKDQSCLLDAGDHPWIHHKTCVRYQDAKCVKEADLDALLSAGKLIQQTSASEKLLRKILTGADLTDSMPNKCRRILIDQDLIDGS